MIRVAWDHQIFAVQQFGGVSRYFAMIANAIAAEPDLSLDIYAPFHVNEHIDQVARALVHGRKLPMSPRAQRFAFHFDRWAIRPALSAARPDVVHETYYSSARTGPKRARILLTVYDMIHERFRDQFAGDPTAERKRAALKRADHIACISESTRRDLLERMPELEPRTSVTLLGFSPPAAVAAGGWPPHQRPYLLFVGPRAGYKNFLGLLAAYAASAKVHGAVDLVCAGGGAFDAAERAAIAEAGMADRVSQRPADDHQLGTLYARAAAFAYPSLYEGFGIPPLEAMAAGTPVIAIRSSSVPEVCGDAAAYAEPGSCDSLVVALEQVLLDSDVADRLRMAGARRLASFSWARCAADTAMLYRRLA